MKLAGKVLIILGLGIIFVFGYLILKPKSSKIFHNTEAWSSFTNDESVTENIDTLVGEPIDRQDGQESGAGWVIWIF